MRPTLSLRRNPLHLDRLTMILLCLTMGCSRPAPGPARLPVSGQITLNGQPVDDLILRLVPEQGSAGVTVSTLVTAGKFQFDRTSGPTAARYRVELVPRSPWTIPLDDESAFAAAHGNPTPTPATPNLPQLTARVEVTPNQPLNLALTAPWN